MIMVPTKMNVSEKLHAAVLFPIIQTYLIYFTAILKFIFAQHHGEITQRTLHLNEVDLPKLSSCKLLEHLNPK